MCEASNLKKWGGVYYESEEHRERAGGAAEAPPEMPLFRG